MAIRISADLKIKGAKEITNNLRAYSERFPDKAADALYDVMSNDVEPEVYDETPVKSGNLRDTIHTADPEVNGKRISCQILAGGPDAPYALIVHEDLDAFHAVGDAKYIERPLNRASKDMAQRLADRLQVTEIL